MGQLTTDVAKRYIILGTPDDCRSQDEYEVAVTHWYTGDVDINIGVHNGLDAQGEPVFYNIMSLYADSMDDMLRWMPTHVKRLLSPELYEKLTRLLHCEEVVQ